MPRILRDSLRTLSSSDDQPSSLSRAGPGHHVQRQRRRERRAGRQPGQRLAHVARPPSRATGRRRPRRARSCSRSMPAWPAPDAAWYEAATSSPQPPPPVQRAERGHHRQRRAVGVGDDALRPDARPASALTSGTTSGTSGSIRNAPELSTTTAPRAAATGAHCADTASGTSNMATSTPSKTSGASACDRRRPRRAPAASGRPTAAEATSRISPHEERRARTGCRASRCRPRRSRRRRASVGCGPARAHRPVPAYTVASSAPPSSNASCTARTARSRSVSRTQHRDPDLRGGDQLDVDPGVGQRAEEPRPTPRGASASRRRPGRPCRRGRRTAASRSRPPPAPCCSAAMPAGPSVLGSVKEMSVRAVAATDTFCTIMSMLISASATARKMRRGLARLVRHGDHGDLGLAAVVRDAGDDRLLHLQVLHRAGDQGPRQLRERRPDLDRDAVPARVLHRPQVQHLRAARGHLQHLLVRDRVQPAGPRHDPRVGREHAVDVGVDLADVRARARRPARPRWCPCRPGRAW